MVHVKLNKVQLSGVITGLNMGQELLLKDLKASQLWEDEVSKVSYQNITMGQLKAIKEAYKALRIDSRMVLLDDAIYNFLDTLTDTKRFEELLQIYIG